MRLIYQQARICGWGVTNVDHINGIHLGAADKGEVALKTMMRTINIEFWPKEAPKTVCKFVQFCLEGYYNRNFSMGMNFYNVSKML